MNDNEIIQIIITVFGSVIASSGFWAFLQKRSERKDVRAKLLAGLAHDRITSLGMEYIERGWINEDEFEELHDYLYLPYKEAGGNGSAERIMNEVKKLPLKKQSRDNGGEENE